MANLGRYACVAVPFLLTLGALIALLVAGLGGVADKSLYMFQVNLTEMSISPLDAKGIIEDVVKDALNTRSPTPVAQLHDWTLLQGDKHEAQAAQGSNITAADLGLYDLYDIAIWGYCYTTHNGTRDCTKPAFNWAEGVLGNTTDDLTSLITLTGQNVTLPKEITDAVKLFGNVSRWTQIVFIVACIALGVALFFGIFANCSRAFSCITLIISLVATVAVCGTAALATATAVIVVGAVETAAQIYGVEASFNTKFLATVWIAAAFAIAAGFFWMFTTCCCAPDRSRGDRRSRHLDEDEKLMNGPYQPIQQPAGGAAPGGYPQSYSNQQYGAPRRDLAYEPYSHTNV